MWQHVKLSEQIRPWDTHACCWDVKQATNQPTSVCPEDSSCSPDESPSCPDRSHLVSLSQHSDLAVFHLSCYLDGFSCLVHRLDVPRGYSRCCPRCQKGSQPCSFLSVFTTLHRKSPWWRPFLAQVNVLSCCRWCFCNWSFFTGTIVSPTQTPLSSGRVGPALVAPSSVSTASDLKLSQLAGIVKGKGCSWLNRGDLPPTEWCLSLITHNSPTS